jgi:CRISPR-associated protein Cmr6
MPANLGAKKPTGDYNGGLWYDKFFGAWDDAYAEVPNGEKAAWVEQFKSPIGGRTRLAEQHERLQRLIFERGGQIRHFKTTGRFVTGLGREHPIENGFAWHHTLGVPYLPGASVKGLLRAWSEQNSADEHDIKRIFGSALAGNAGVGSVIFGDALPPEPVRLIPDVMTPHYSPYYQDDEAVEPPADWHAPQPIPFLTVDVGQSFVFTLAPRQARNAQDDSDCEIAARWLAEALFWLGAGAKTAVGYGRFTANEAADQAVVEKLRQTRQVRTRAAQLAKRLRGLSPLAQELERAIESAQLDTDKNVFTRPPLIEDWLTRLEVAPEPDAVQRFRELVRCHFPSLLENPDKTKGKKRKPEFNDRQRALARRLNLLVEE